MWTDDGKIGNFYIIKDFPYRWIAEAKGSHVNKVSREEIEANAHLIAAAPELLEALEEAVFLLDGYLVQHGSAPSMAKKMKGLKSVIAKATGKKERVQ
jgi:hypothetical protein